MFRNEIKNIGGGFGIVLLILAIILLTAFLSFLTPALTPAHAAPGKTPACQIQVISWNTALKPSWTMTKNKHGHNVWSKDVGKKLKDQLVESAINGNSVYKSLADCESQGGIAIVIAGFSQFNTGDIEFAVELVKNANIPIATLALAPGQSYSQESVAFLQELGWPVIPTTNCWNDEKSIVPFAITIGKIKEIAGDEIRYVLAPGANANYLLANDFKKNVPAGVKIIAVNWDYPVQANEIQAEWFQ